MLRHFATFHRMFRSIACWVAELNVRLWCQSKNITAKILPNSFPYVGIEFTTVALQSHPWALAPQRLNYYSEQIEHSIVVCFASFPCNFSHRNPRRACRNCTKWSGYTGFAKPARAIRLDSTKSCTHGEFLIFPAFKIKTHFISLSVWFFYAFVLYKMNYKYVF